METTAKLSFIRLSPRKAKLVVDLVRGAKLERALTELRLLPQAAAKPVLKLLQSAAANARQNNKLAIADLWVSRIEVGQGPRLKRWQPRAMGRATPIQRPTAHIRVVLSDQAPAPRRSR